MVRNSRDVCSAWSAPPGVAAAHLRPLCVHKPQPSIVWPWALVCGPRSAQSQGSFLHTQLMLSSPPRHSPHPPLVPSASKESPITHWQMPIPELLTSGKENTDYKESSHEVARSLRRLVPGLTFPSTTRQSVGSEAWAGQWPCSDLQL